MNTIDNLLPIQNQSINTDDHNNKKTTNSNLDLQNNFLEIFLSQMQNQDPMNPLTNTELTSQLTAINTANGIEKINSNLIELKK
ncbi:MAG TPA: flagellar hook capping FlgD N-terminal domain-containing protein, partial [Buchnera sp. (in: enterobacteria)]|nr:flagellar hook capping FlgD N-terminal domain-containing protein [Buchnera sp. (in: enterobacteria)]